MTNLLANVTELHKLHVKLVAEFQQATHPYPYYTNCIGNIFLKYVSLKKAFMFCELFLLLFFYLFFIISNKKMLLNSTVVCSNFLIWPKQGFIILAVLGRSV